MDSVFLLTPRDVYREFGLSPNWLDMLQEAGVLQNVGGGYQRSAIQSLQEGVDYVVCRVCGAWMGEITRHLRAQHPSIATVDAYVAEYPGAAWRASRAVSRKAKTPEQRLAQSEKLKARFLTPAGEATRDEISRAAKRMQAGDYGIRAAAHLRDLNARPEQRASRSVESQARWDSGELRMKTQAWRDTHPDDVLASASHARSHIKKHFTQLHRSVKDALVADGMDGFVTEYKVGFYSVDEALPNLWLAVEVDGCYWHGCATCGYPGVGAIKSCDARKTSYLLNRGWTIIRLAEHEVHADLGTCVRKVRDTVEQLSRGAV